MSNDNRRSKVVSIDEQAFEDEEKNEVDEEGFEVVDETPEFRATVDQQVQAKVDANHPEGIVGADDGRIPVRHSYRKNGSTRGTLNSNTSAHRRT